VQLDEETANVTKTTIKLDKINTDGSSAKSGNQPEQQSPSRAANTTVTSSEDP